MCTENASVLPRPARDKHRERALQKKRRAFSYSVFGNRCSALAKFAMVCSVEEAMETGLTVKDKNGADLQLELTLPKSDDFFVKVQLRHLDLLARGKEEEAAAFRKEHDEKIQAAKAEQAGVPATLPDRPHSAHALRGPSRAPDRPQSAR
jgi:hypothetical protein